MELDMETIKSRIYCHRGYWASAVEQNTAQALADAAGRGFGKSALKEAIERNRDRGFTQMTLWVFANNDIANSLYSKSGFAPTGNSRTTPEWGALEIELIAAL